MKATFLSGGTRRAAKDSIPGCSLHTLGNCVRRLLLVTGDCLFTIWVVFPLQTGVVVRVLLLGFIFLLIRVCVAVCFLVGWFGGVVSVSVVGLWVYSSWLSLETFSPAVLLLCLLNSGGDARW
ncbi:transmembrane protein, putative [Medicago truncatula]|uniref:Transmembrane protein, putative n=1 Tax=Medicago truncatula TaxID=3880 RepID=A0A072UD21_MEDTR|nr:transmembrane protein, putative [Medicago truncatula]